MLVVSLPNQVYSKFLNGDALVLYLCIVGMDLWSSYIYPSRGLLDWVLFS